MKSQLSNSRIYAYQWTGYRFRDDSIIIIAKDIWNSKSRLREFAKVLYNIDIPRGRLHWREIDDIGSIHGI